MAITSLDGIIAGAQSPQFFSKFITPPSGGKACTAWAAAGIPGPGSYNTTLNGGTYSSSGGIVAGQIPHFDPAGGTSYLNRLACMGQGNNGTMYLCDRLWDNGGITITSTTLQSITSPTWPARDLYGQTGGRGVVLALEVSAATASTQTVTVGYTNSAGTSGRTASINVNAYTGTVTGSMGFFAQAAGDIGVQSVQSVQLGASMTSGTINLVALRVITAINISGVTWLTANGLDSVKSGFPQIFNGAVPFLVFFSAGSVLHQLVGTYGETQG